MNKFTTQHILTTVRNKERR